MKCFRASKDLFLESTEVGMDQVTTICLWLWRLHALQEEFPWQN